MSDKITYQRCGDCDHVWYFKRAFCPRCGSEKAQSAQACGNGRIEAVTTVTRAPSAELRAYAPYTLVLARMDEGFRMMAHAAPEVGIGDAVTAAFAPFGERSVPRFTRKPS